MGAVTAGTKLGRYELTSELHGRDLWLARTDDAREVVVRILPPDQVADPKLARLTDAWASGELHHPSIVAIEDVGDEGGVHYLACEHVHGEALVQLMARVDDRGKQISLQHVLGIAIAIAEAMHHAHELGIQCAITPSQVLLGYDSKIKLDLGRVGMPPRPAYRSPEHAANLATDRRSDVFTIGIVMYECLTLDPLFESGPGPVAKPSTLRKGLPSELEKIVMRALASDPSERHGTAGELRAALTQFATKSGMKLGGNALAMYLKQMFDKRDVSKPSTASRAFGRPATSPTNPPTGTEDPTGKVSFLQGDRAKTKPAKPTVSAKPVGTVKGKLVSVDPTEETKLPDTEVTEETLVSPPPLAGRVSPKSKLAPMPPPRPPIVAAPRPVSEPDPEEQREPTMITSPPPPPLVIASTLPEHADATPVVKPLPAPGVRRPSTARSSGGVPTALETEMMSAVAPPRRKKLWIAGGVVIALAIPVVIALWPSPVTRQVAAQPSVEPAPVVERPEPIAAGHGSADEAEPEPAAEPAALEPPIEPAAEPPAEPAVEPANDPESDAPKPSVFVPREGSGSADAPKPKPQPKVAAKPRPRVAAKSKPVKKPATKPPKAPTYDPDSLFLKKK